MVPAGGEAWRPLLDGDSRAEALGRVRAIAEQLAGAIDDSSFPALAGGLGGFALFYQYCDAALPDQGHGELALELLERTMEAGTRPGLHLGLFGGYAGIGWLCDHLGASSDEVDACQPFDQVIGQALAGRWSGTYDLTNGLVGLGVYALERGERGAGRAILARVLDHLVELSVEVEGGTSWHTPVEQLVAWQARSYPQGYYNLGVAHGVPGVLALLARAVAAGHADRAPLLESGLSWLAAQAQPGGDAWYGVCRSDAGLDPPTRSAWCYGDPGIAAVLVGAGSGRWRDLGVELARTVAGRSAERAGCADAGLCHGSAGLAHLLNRIHQATGDAGVGEAARDWYRRTLAFRASSGVAGYAEAAPAHDEASWEASAGLLTGAVGTGLALLAASTDIPPDWDRLFLVDL